MNRWLERVGELTAAHREARAQGFAVRGRRRFWQRREEGFSDVYARTDEAWFAARARGQRERPQRVAACGADTLQISCAGCGLVHERRSGCRIGLLCVPCRSAGNGTKRAIFRRARAVSVDEAAQRGLFRADRRGGAWTEKFLTLTAPHFRQQSIAERIAVVLRAWVRFLRLLNAHWKAQGVRSAEWFRVLEWTPGTDHLGHPHFHLWILSPYLPGEDVRAWWRHALSEACGESIEQVIVKIGKVYGDSADQELIKYMTKDITASGEKLAPELYAQVYEALDGHRSTQASRGFMAKAKATRNACECGCALPRRVRKQPAQTGEVAK